MGQHDLAGRSGDLGLGPAEPRPVGNGERGGKYRSHATGSTCGPPQRRNQRAGIGSVPCVVPQRRFANGPPTAVQHDHPVLLSCDRYRCDLCGHPGFVEGRRNGYLPGNWVGLACSSVALYIVASRPRGHDAARRRGRPRGPWSIASNNQLPQRAAWYVLSRRAPRQTPVVFGSACHARSQNSRTVTCRAPDATVNEDLRRNNLAALVRNLHLSGPLTRSQLTARTRLNRSTVAGLVGELASTGLVRESPSPSGGATGRPSHVVSLAAERVWVLAVELAAEALVVARVGPGGQLQERLAQPRDTRRKLAPAEAAATIGSLASQLMSREPPGAQLVGAAVAVPGIVRRGEGFVHLAPNLAWKNVPFGALLSEHLPGKLGVLVANEADLGALAECARGAAVGHRHVIYVSGNTGVGAGIVVDGALLAGRSGYAGEVGHMKMNPDGQRCRCGAEGAGKARLAHRRC